MPERKELTVRLWHEEGQLFRQFHRPVYEHIGEPSPVEWPEPTQPVRLWGWEGLEELARVLDLGLEKEVEVLAQKQQAEVGELLFETLFGPTDVWEPVLKGFHTRTDGSITNPVTISYPLRIRVWTEDPVLLGLPWRLTTWKGRRLVDQYLKWTFEVTSREPRDRTIELHSLSPVLAVAPRVSEVWLNRALMAGGDPRTFTTSTGPRPALTDAGYCIPAPRASGAPRPRPEGPAPPDQGPKGRHEIARVRQGRAACRCSRISPALLKLFEPRLPTITFCRNIPSTRPYGPTSSASGGGINRAFSRKSSPPNGGQGVIDPGFSQGRGFF